jgi:hypothetical protein
MVEIDTNVSEEHYTSSFKDGIRLLDYMTQIISHCTLNSHAAESSVRR